MSGVEVRVGAGEGAFFRAGELARWPASRRARNGYGRYGGKISPRTLASLLCDLYPTPNQGRNAFCNLLAEYHLIYIPHVKHIDDPAKVRASTFPPGVMGVDNQIVLHVNALFLLQFLKFHSVQ